MEKLFSGKMGHREIQALQESYEATRKELNAMPGGIPRTADDVRRILPHINPLEYKRNCTEASMAVDDVLAGRAAVAGNSRHTNVLPDRFVDSNGKPVGGKIDGAASNTDGFERELLDAGPGSRGILWMARSNGDGHSANMANLDGQVYRIDGQLSGYLKGPDGARLPVILDNKQWGILNKDAGGDFEFFKLFRTDS
ncbi:toxin glutamine deamidase domain-containing protein [Nonomuraea longispora]|nr:toxin glutamine deamidase domain-containing protein [Nonomuraea longispora]